MDIPLQRPAGGVTPAGEAYEYNANDMSIGDVDGDGQYEIILKWDPSNAHDNAHDGYTGNVYFDCYRLTGEKLWRIDYSEAYYVFDKGEETEKLISYLRQYQMSENGKSMLYQDGGELIVETPGGTTSGSGISETWLGQKLDALGDRLSGIKESIKELPNKFENLFSNLAEGLANLLQPVQQILQFLVGTTYVESPLEALHFDALFSLFPFNIPYGIYQAIDFWSASPSAPTITIPLPIYDGEIDIYEYKINLSDVPGMDTLAAILRAGELILFVVGLVMITRKVTKW